MHVIINFSLKWIARRLIKLECRNSVLFYFIFVLSVLSPVRTQSALSKLRLIRSGGEAIFIRLCEINLFVMTFSFSRGYSKNLKKIER